MAIKQRVFKMTLKEEKKNSVRYNAADGEKNPPLDSAYVSKLAFDGDEYPDEIWITVSATKPK